MAPSKYKPTLKGYQWKHSFQCKEKKHFKNLSSQHYWAEGHWYYSLPAGDSKTCFRAQILLYAHFKENGLSHSTKHETWAERSAEEENPCGKQETQGERSHWAFPLEYSLPCLHLLTRVRGCLLSLIISFSKFWAVDQYGAAGMRNKTVSGSCKNIEKASRNGLLQEFFSAQNLKGSAFYFNKI